jgi:hypothetical protein
LAPPGGVEGRVVGLLTDGGFDGFVDGRDTLLPPPPEGRWAGLVEGREALLPPPEGRLTDGFDDPPPEGRDTDLPPLPPLPEGRE